MQVLLSSVFSLFILKNRIKKNPINNSNNYLILEQK